MNPSITGKQAAERATVSKDSKVWQAAQWKRWPREDDWPAKMDIFEAAAYLRTSSKTLRNACAQGRDKKARLRHQRIGWSYRFRRVDLDGFGVVEIREPAKA